MKKLDKQFIQTFEDEQKRFGTETALYNIVWLICSDQFKSWLGVTHVRADDGEEDEQL